MGQMFTEYLKISVSSVKSVDPLKNPCLIRENPWLKEKSNLDSTTNRRFAKNFGLFRRVRVQPTRQTDIQHLYYKAGTGNHQFFSRKSTLFFDQKQMGDIPTGTKQKVNANEKFF